MIVIKKAIFKKLLIVLLSVICILPSFNTTVNADSLKSYNVDVVNNANASVNKYIHSLRLDEEPDGTYSCYVNNIYLASKPYGDLNFVYSPASSVTVNINFDLVNKNVDFYVYERVQKNNNSSVTFQSNEDGTVTAIFNPTIGSSSGEQRKTVSESGGVYDFGTFYATIFGGSYSFAVKLDSNENKAYIIPKTGTKLEFNVSPSNVTKLIYYEYHTNLQPLELEYQEKVTLKKYSLEEAAAVTYSDSDFNTAVQGKTITLRNVTTNETVTLALTPTIGYWTRDLGPTTGSQGDSEEGTGTYGEHGGGITVVCQWWDTGLNGECTNVRRVVGTNNRLFSFRSQSGTRKAYKTYDVGYLKKTFSYDDSGWSTETDTWHSLKEGEKAQYKYSTVSYSDWSNWNMGYTPSVYQTGAIYMSEEKGFYKYRTYTWADVTGWNTTDKMYGEKTVTKTGSYPECGSYNKSCETSGCGIENYKYCRTSACGVESYKYCQHSNCGVNRYKECRDSACGGGGNKYCQSSACGVAYYKTCQNSACGVDHYEYSRYGGAPYPVYKSCQNSACGVGAYKGCYSPTCGQEPYNSCRTPACGVESYKSCNTSGCGVEQYKQCTHQDCGVVYKYCQHKDCGTVNYNCTLYKNQNKSYSNWSDYSYASCPYIPSVDGTECDGPATKYRYRTITWSPWSSWYDTSSKQSASSDKKVKFRFNSGTFTAETKYKVAVEGKIVDVEDDLAITYNNAQNKQDGYTKDWKINWAAGNYKTPLDNETKAMLFTTALAYSENAPNTTITASENVYVNAKKWVPYFYIADHWRAVEKEGEYEEYRNASAAPIPTTVNNTEHGPEDEDIDVPMEDPIEADANRNTKVIYFDYRKPLTNYQDELPDNWKGYERLLEEIKQTNTDEYIIRAELSKQDLIDMREYLRNGGYNDENCEFLKKFAYIFKTQNSDLSSFLSGAEGCKIK